MHFFMFYIIKYKKLQIRIKFKILNNLRSAVFDFKKEVLHCYCVRLL